MRFSRNPVSDQLATMRIEAEKRDAMRRASAERLPFFESEVPSDKDALLLVPEITAKAARAAVVERKGEEVTFVVFTMTNQKVRDVLASLKGQGLTPKVSITTLRVLERLWAGYVSDIEKEPAERRKIASRVRLSKERIDEVRNKISNIKEAVSFFEKLAKNIETSTLLGYILGAALALRASDIHMEHITKEESLLRFRVDGTLKDITKLGEKQTRLLVSRVKLLAGLKLNITDAPQDGRFTIESPTGDMEVRSSIVPAEFGEAIVMRVLDPSIIGLELAQLGLREDDEKIIDRELMRPNGMILVTGPTGSGKTTTLYAFLKKVNSPKIKIITIEDPIEYHLAGIEQTQTDEESNYTFASGLRSVLRQDPDVILVGEIRDSETASVSVNAALTGHLVFSTLHTNNAAGAIPRLIDLGVKQSTIGPAVMLVIAQRLVRRLCADCREELDIDKELRAKIEALIKGLPKKISRDSIKIQLHEAVGCESCEGGYRGRIAILELLEIGDTMDSLIREKATERDIQETAIKKQGMVLMQNDGILKALRGITTLEEVERVTGSIEW